jgi:hypothetical protein
MLHHIEPSRREYGFHLTYKHCNCNTPVFNLCNFVLIMNVIISLKQIWNKFNQIVSKFKTRSEFYFSFEID